MKAINLIGLLLVLTFASCKKSDVNEINENQTPELSVATAANQEWQVSNNWKTSGSSHEASIVDATITEDIASNGLVLVYVKGINGNAVTLPSQIGQTNWFYQVENGLIQISATQKDGAQFNQEQPFSYVVFSKDQLSSFAERGITKSDLIKMNHEQVKQLSK